MKRFIIIYLYFQNVNFEFSFEKKKKPKKKLLQGKCLMKIIGRYHLMYFLNR